MPSFKLMFQSRHSAARDIETFALELAVDFAHAIDPEDLIKEKDIDL